jgi:hypothetical protein
MCRTTYSLEEATSTGMRCHRCGRRLDHAEGEWFTRDVEIYSGGDNGKVYSEVSVKVAELQLPANNEVDAEAVGHFITSLPLPLSLEIYGEGDRRVMLVRGEMDSLRFLAAQVIH